MSVLVRLSGREALLAGDAIYTMRNLRDDILPWRTAGEETHRRSMSELRAYTEENPGALVIPTHDEEVWQGLDELY
jgi:N-acyl homoserine lactone hydrolase